MKTTVELMKSEDADAVIECIMTGLAKSSEVTNSWDMGKILNVCYPRNVGYFNSTSMISTIAYKEMSNKFMEDLEAALDNREES